MRGQMQSGATATAAFLPLGTGPASYNYTTVVTVTEVGIQWTVTSVAGTSLPRCGVSVLGLEVSALDDDDDDVDRDNGT